jgi:hypothetical protein
MIADPVPLDLERLLTALSRHEVQYVITGSVAALAHGVELSPGDLDIAPALTAKNLDALAGLLDELGAKPKHVPTWRQGPSREACERWLAHPATETNLDYRFMTPYGELDVVPRRAGAYDELITRAVHMTAFELPILVAHLDDLISLCERWGRGTDRARLPVLNSLRSGPEGSSTGRDVGARLGRRAGS